MPGLEKAVFSASLSRSSPVQFGGEFQRGGQLLQLEVRPEVRGAAVAPRLARLLRDLNRASRSGNRALTAADAWLSGVTYFWSQRWRKSSHSSGPAKLPNLSRTIALT